MVYIHLAEGFEEVEALTVCDMLRRADIPCQLVSVGNDIFVKGAHHITVKADILIKDANYENADAIVLPGGMPGTTGLMECEYLKKQILKFNSEGKKVCAICAAPMILGRLGIIKGKEATIYSGMEDEIAGSVVTHKDCVASGNIITANGPGSAAKFGAAIIASLKGEKAAETVLKGMLLL